MPYLIRYFLVQALYDGTEYVFYYFRHVTLFEELMLLKEFEKREYTFATRVLTKEDEQEEMEDKVIIFSGKLS